jgi:hypothetical protein
MLLRPRSLAFFIVVLFAVGAHSRAAAQQSHPRQVDVHVDSVLATDTDEGIDERLSSIGRQLQALFSYSTYRLVNHQDGAAQCGKMIAFTLPGGRILHVQPRAVDGDMIAMELVLFQGPRPIMTTDLKLKNRGLLILGGPRYQQGMLIISIGASTPDDGPERHSTAAAHPGAPQDPATPP